MTAASPLARYRAVDGALPSGSAAPSYTITGDTTQRLARGVFVLSEKLYWQLKLVTRQKAFHQSKVDRVDELEIDEFFEVLAHFTRPCVPSRVPSLFLSSVQP